MHANHATTFTCRRSQPVAAIYFGAELSFDGDTLAVAARGYDSVFVYGKSGTTWTLDDQITIDVEARVGSAASIRSVALDGNRIAIGAATNSGYKGAAFMFRRGTGGWTEAGVTTATGTQQAQFFGASVALKGELFAVGASGLARYSAQSMAPQVRGAVYSN